MIQMLMMVLLTTFLVSCQNIKPLIQCDIKFQNVCIDGDCKKVIADRCRCRCYSISSIKTVNKKLCERDWSRFYTYNENLFEIIDRKKMIPIEHPINLDIRSCDKISGFKLEDIATEIIPWGRSVQNESD